MPEHDTLPGKAPGAQECAREGQEAAERAITSEADAGMEKDAIARSQDDIANGLLSEAATAEACGFARSYSVTASALVADLRDVSCAEPSREPGTPHPDPFLAARGWEVGRSGIYTRTAQRQPDRELEAG